MNIQSTPEELEELKIFHGEYKILLEDIEAGHPYTLKRLLQSWRKSIRLIGLTKERNKRFNIFMDAAERTLDMATDVLNNNVVINLDLDTTNPQEQWLNECAMHYDDIREAYNDCVNMHIEFSEMCQKQEALTEGATS